MHSNTSAKTNSSYDPNEWRPYDQAAAAVAVTLATAIIGFNAVVIYTLLLRTQKKNRLFFYILHLAIADLLVGVVCCLGDGIQSAMYGAWYGGDGLCRIWRYSKFVLLMASNNVLVGMSVDRFIAVRYPLYIIRMGVCAFLDRGLVILAWVLGILSPAWIIYYIRGQNGTVLEGGRCDIGGFTGDTFKIYMFAMGAVIVLLPLCAIAICYTGISIVVWRKWREGLKLSEEKSTARLQRNRTRNRGLLPRAKVKTVKMTFFICLAFLFCWLPYFVFSFLDVYGYNSIDHKLYMVIGNLYTLNSACNPVIFIVFNTKLFTRRGDSRLYGAATTYDGASTLVTQNPYSNQY